MTDLSHVPQLSETPAERDQRMRWFRDAKFGMFIHWGPCAVGEREIGWGRNARRPFDINVPEPSSDRYDDEYDNYYKVFDPVQYDPDAWARFAVESGMKYMVLITKHHDGFSMFDTKLSDYSIMATPYGRDIVGPFVAACQRHGLKSGLYYSTRDWFHEDYLAGDNSAYDAWYRSQVEELLSNYGKVDVMWFDHVGGRDWSKWRFDELFAMMYRLQPELLVNNRAARFCGPATAADEGPETPELEQVTQGDYYTPEGRIGAIDLERDWESCIHCGQGWSYRGEDGFKGPEECIKMLASCVTGGGNLLLNFGPRPDGTFTDGETAVARAMGEWLQRYGEAIYGTRGGPYRNGSWGGSCHRDDKIYLHVYNWPDGPLTFDPLPRRVLGARTLDGAPVAFVQTDEALSIDVAAADRGGPVSVLELTIDSPLAVGTLCGEAQLIPQDLAAYGEIISGEATLEISAASQWDHAEHHDKLFNGSYSPSGYAFHTERSADAWAVVDLGDVCSVKGVLFENWTDQRLPMPLVLSVSTDGDVWEEVWQAAGWDEQWFAEICHFHAGINVPGRDARFLKLAPAGNKQVSLFMRRLTVYGDRR
jgi:alpha-L-fucosidase